MTDVPRSSGQVDEPSTPSDDSPSQLAPERNRKSGQVPSEAQSILTDPPVQNSQGDQRRKQSICHRAFWLVLCITIILWLILNVKITIAATLEHSKLIGVSLIIFVTALLVFLFISMYREYTSYRKIDHLSKMKQSIKNSKDIEQLNEALRDTINNISSNNKQLIDDFKKEAREGNIENTTDYMNKFSDIVLKKLDAKADEAIKRSIIVGSVGVAVIPHPALDAFFVLWRAKKLTREIGQIYGLEPTGLSSWLLLRHSISSALIAASAEGVSEVVVQNLAVGIANKISILLAESSVTALRLYRLGKIVQKTCRPIEVSTN